MIERPKGTRDFPPEEMARRRHLEGVFARVARRFGYGEVATPTFEHAELFITKSGPGIVEELYAFRDKGGRELALRPELTAPVIRFYLSDLQGRPKPLKLYYFGSCFRYDEPQFGRYREFEQFGVEILGASPLESDAEVVATAVSALQEAGLTDFEIRLGHIGLIRDLLPVEAPSQAAILHALDKGDAEALHRELEAAGLVELEASLRELVSLQGGTEVLERAQALVGEQDALTYLDRLGRRLAVYGIEEVEYNLRVVRGLDYYTGAVFELHCEPLGAASQVCGGGAYTLTDVFGGEPLPTTGFAIGFDRVLLALEEAGVSLPVPVLEAFVVPVGDHMREVGVGVLRRLRDEGVSADIDLVGRGPSKNLDHASSAGARYAVLVGEREWARGAVGLKDLATGEQREVPLGELPSAVRGSGEKDAPIGI